MRIVYIHFFIILYFLTCGIKLTHQHGEADNEEVSTSFSFIKKQSDSMSDLEISIGRSTIRTFCFYLASFSNGDNSRLFKIQRNFCQLYLKQLKNNYKKHLKIYKTQNHMSSLTFPKIKRQSKGKTLNSLTVTRMLTPIDTLGKQEDVQSRILEKDMKEYPKTSKSGNGSPHQRHLTKSSIRVTKPSDGGYHPWTIGDFKSDVKSGHKTRYKNRKSRSVVFPDSKQIILLKPTSINVKKTINNSNKMNTLYLPNFLKEKVVKIYKKCLTKYSLKICKHLHRITLPKQFLKLLNATNDDEKENDFFNFFLTRKSFFIPHMGRLKNEKAKHAPFLKEKRTLIDSKMMNFVCKLISKITRRSFSANGKRHKEIKKKQRAEDEWVFSCHKMS
ncbi:hypothetical protein ILUMI_07587 [Ignelater luminosus]|uniref:Uncharacterized protein n=1 Tax=Ignelater luminosus TaxID=2038154 RepID=A0A8K0D766_IGNLU|nr:hypothetical protein ILUMI_07587 [Ignelater luminosus]